MTSRWSRYYNKMAGTLVRTFGESATYIPTIGQPYDLSGIFDPYSEDVDPDTGAIIQSRQPMFYAPREKLNAEPQYGDRITVQGQTYKIVEVNPDAQGGLELRLQL